MATEKTKQYFSLDELTTLFGEAFAKDVTAWTERENADRAKLSATIRKVWKDKIPAGQTVSIVKGYPGTYGIEFKAEKSAKGCADKLAALGVAVNE